MRALGAEVTGGGGGVVGGWLSGAGRHVRGERDASRRRRVKLRGRRHRSAPGPEERRGGLRELRPGGSARWAVCAPEGRACGEKGGPQARGLPSEPAGTGGRREAGTPGGPGRDAEEAAGVWAGREGRGGRGRGRGERTCRDRRGRDGDRNLGRRLGAGKAASGRRGAEAEPGALLGA